MATVVSTVADTIRGIASDTRVALAMLMGAQMESGMNPDAVGDNGKSHGIFQIYLVAHPNVTAEQAKNVEWATRFMLPEYQKAVGRVDPALWNSNPKQAAALAAFYAERPKVMYPQSRIDSAWSAIQGGTAGTNVSNVANPIDAVGDLWNRTTRWIRDIFGETVDYVYFGSLFLIGGITAAVGFYLLMKESTRVIPAAKAVGQGYRAVLRI